MLHLTKLAILQEGPTGTHSLGTRSPLLAECKQRLAILSCVLDALMCLITLAVFIPIRWCESCGDSYNSVGVLNKVCTSKFQSKVGVKLNMTSHIVSREYYLTVCYSCLLSTSRSYTRMNCIPIFNRPQQILPTALRFPLRISEVALMTLG